MTAKARATSSPAIRLFAGLVPATADVLSTIGAGPTDHVLVDQVDEAAANQNNEDPAGEHVHQWLAQEKHNRCDDHNGDHCIDEQFLEEECGRGLASRFGRVGLVDLRIHAAILLIVTIICNVTITVTSRRYGYAAVMLEQPPLRQRNRLATMRQTQEAAVALMEAGSFADTTIEGIAQASGVSVSTIYRQFGTKENLILWDEQDSAIDAELANRLPRDSTVAAFRDSIIATLVNRPDQDLFLRRLKLIYSVPSIWSAAAEQDRIARRELAAAIAATSGRSRPTTADTVIAATCLAALDVALDTWQKGDGHDRLDALITEALAAATAMTWSG